MVSIHRTQTPKTLEDQTQISLLLSHILLELKKLNAQAELITETTPIILED